MTHLLSGERATARRATPSRPTSERSTELVLADLLDLRRAVGGAPDAHAAIGVITRAGRTMLGVRAIRITVSNGDQDEPTVEALDRVGPAAGGEQVTVRMTGRDGRILGRIEVDAGRGRTLDAVDRQLLASLAQLGAEVIAHGTVERRLRAIVDHAPTAIFLKDRELRYLIANPRAAEIAGAASPEEMIGRTDADFLDPGPAAAIMASDRAILAGSPDVDDEAENQLPGRTAILHAQIFATRDHFGRPSGIGGVVSDVTERRRAEAALAESHQRYRTIFEQANDAIVILDGDGRVADANPAACELLGRPHEAVLESGFDELVVAGSDHWRDYLLAVAASDPGHPVVRGDLQLRRHDGGLIAAEFVAGPQGGDHVMVVRDVTDVRRRQQAARQRLEVIGAIRALSLSNDVEAIAAGIDRAIVDLGGFGGAGVFAFSGLASVELVDAQFATGLRQIDPTVVLPPSVARTVRRRSRTGPWIDDWSERSLAGLDPQLDDLEIGSSVCLPLQHGGEVVGMLAVATRQPKADLAARLPDLEEFADLASARIGPALLERSRLGRDRRRIRRVIERHAFRPVFQPIVDLGAREVVGYEGLTRFADGTPPDRAFQVASQAGIGLELEIATLEAILEASGPLPANRYLDVNVSPDLIVAGGALRSLLREAGFNVVLEVTEHAVIEDYPALRRAIDALGDRVTVAVDDAGAGFASLRHILELKPTYVKLDRALVERIDVDPARQAMVAGLKEYAVRLGVTLIAEGVEREAERETLLALGLERAQGYLFGRPMSAADVMAADRRR